MGMNSWLVPTAHAVGQAIGKYLKRKGAKKHAQQAYKDQLPAMNLGADLDASRRGLGANVFGAYGVNSQGTRDNLSQRLPIPEFNDAGWGTSNFGSMMTDGGDAYMEASGKQQQSGAGVQPMDQGAFLEAYERYKKRMGQVNTGQPIQAESEWM